MKSDMQDIIRCIEGQVVEAVALFENAQKDPFGDGARYEVCHLPAVLRDALAQITMLEKEVDGMKSHRQIDKVLNPTGNYFVRVKFDGERLSITGVDGPLANGDCRGSCGLSPGPLTDFDRESTPPWCEDSRSRLAAIWDRWHLNDMRAGCEHQRAWGWDKRPIDPSKPLHAYGNFIEGNRGSTWNMLVWVSRDEHPEGLLCEPCPECGYKYGSAWLMEKVPAGIIDELDAMPKSKRTPAWC